MVGELFSNSALEKATKNFKTEVKKLQGDTDTKVESDAEKARRIDRLLTHEHIDEYIQYYFDPNNSLDLKPLGYFHKRLLNDIFEKKIYRHRLEWYRGAGKSKMVSLFIPTLLIAKKMCKGIVVVSQNEDKAMVLLNQITIFLNESKRFQEDYDILGVSGNASNRQIHIKGMKKNEKMGIWGFGLGGNPAGITADFNRPNVIICDDSDMPKMSSNVVYNALDFIFGILWGVPDIRDDKFFFFANNRITPKGLTAHVAGDQKMDGITIPSGIHPSIVHLTEDPETKKRLFFSQGGKLSWPEGADEDKIKKSIEDEGGEDSDQVRRMYYNQANQGGRVFKHEYIVYKTLPDLKDMDQVVSYCDNATASELGCRSAIITIGKKKHSFYIYDAYIENCKFFAKEHYTIYEQYLPYVRLMGHRFKFYCEYGGLSSYLYKDQYEKLEAEGIMWKPIKDDRKKEPKLERIANIVRAFDSFRVCLNDARRHSLGMRRLVEEMSSFPDDKNRMDGLDAMEGALYILGVHPRDTKPLMIPRMHTASNRRVGLINWG